MILILKLTNVNDNAPTFNQPIYTFNLDENINRTPYVLDQTPTIIQITDIDLNLPSDASAAQFQNELNVQLIGKDSHKFLLKKMNISTPASAFYRLVALTPFDAETKNLYELEINVFDGQTTVKAPLTVSINDVNDNRPRFKFEEEASSITKINREDHLVEVSIDENRPALDFVYLFKSIDLDRTPKMNETLYKITSVSANRQGFNNLMSVFELDSATGELRVGRGGSAMLDRELFEYFKLTVRAYNPENESVRDEMTLVVRLDDLNDNAPVFDELVYGYNLREKNAFPAVVAPLNAQDKDQGANGHVTYTIEAINGREYKNEEFFYIDGE